MQQLHSLFRTFYNWLIRPLLPTKISLLNGVAVRGQIKLLDITDEFPNYEDAICQSIRKHVGTGNNVVIVGGGLGVSSVIAANQVGNDGKVYIYEGSESQVNKVKETIHLNRMTNRVELSHAVVGQFFEDSIERYGPVGEAEEIRANELPSCDVLELDCEGAEMEILANLNIRPSTVIVETHGYLGSDVVQVEELLNEQGYDVIERGCEWEAKGVYVLTAIQKNEPQPT